MSHTGLMLMLESWVASLKITDDDSRPSICVSGLEW
jgi:hypothetical protein